MTIQLHIEADNADDLMSMLAKFTGGGAPAETQRRTRTTAPKGDGAAVGTTGTGAAADLPLGMGAPQPDPDLMGTPPPPANTQAPKAMTLDEFLAAVKALLGKGKDDAIRNKVAEMGFARVRDVPPDKFGDVLKTVSAL